ncbi:hypothetical protein C3B72_08850 [Clostridium tetani]|uniref:RAMP superfamily CRISPR-associated protein n=1 Tax=Clostridium tetani TaxID=1513 RepID=UPI000D225025|nr:RAMP superfamily CRISPR-associated protein [Clostridium tetani]AVP55247.1 hypothetical protein C3B72_08850 [Clostridium tetani]
MDKPYSFISLLGKRNYKVNDKHLYRGKIKLRITTLTPLYICKSDVWEKCSGILRKKFYKVNDKYLIPGSSLKGVVRTIAESVSYSCISTRQNKYMIKEFSTNNSKCNCIVCKTFGRMFYKSKVFFNDFELKRGNTFTKYIPKLMVPHPEKEYYKEDGFYKGIKFYYHGMDKIIEKGSIPVEAIKPSSYFEGEIIFKELDLEQLKLLCFSMGLDGSIQPKIGYNKPGYFGSCDIQVMEVKLEEIDGLEVVERQFNTKKLASEWGKSDGKVLDNINELREILNYGNAKKVSQWKINKFGKRGY